jgi:hypothetical protein
MPIVPDKANAPLSVYPDAVPAGTPALQRFKAIGGRDAHIVEPLGGIEHPQFPPGERLDLNRQAARHLAIAYPCRFLVGETPDHAPIITLLVT